MNIKMNIKTLVIIGLLSSTVVQAHDPGLSFVRLELNDAQMSTYLNFSLADINALVTIDNDGSGDISTRELAQAQARLNTLAADLLIVSVDEQRITMKTKPVIKLEQNDGIRFELSFSMPTGSKLQIDSPLIERLASGHRQFISFSDGYQRRHRKILSAQQATLALNL